MTIFLIVLAIILSGAAGLAGALTGAGAPKPLRRVGVPLISMVFALVILWRWQLVFLMARAGVLSQGYGTPSPDDDKPSAIGAFWYRIFNKDSKKTAIATRAAIGLQECLVLSLIPFSTGHWFWYLPACVVIIGTWVYFGAIKQNEGTFEFFGKPLLWEEFLIHSVNTFTYLSLAATCR
jgi:hypothetical protein